MGTFIYFCDGYFIWKYQLSNGFLSRYAGASPFSYGYSGDGEQATTAQLHTPTGISLSTLGLLYICDYGNYLVRVIATTGIITTFAGSGDSGYAGDGGLATSSQISKTTADIKIALSDLKLLKRIDFKKLLKWRQVMIEGFYDD
jgi:hypothetical protein